MIFSKTKHYFLALDDEKKIIVDNMSGEFQFTIEEFKEFCKQDYKYSCTIKLQRFIKMNYDFVELDKFYINSFNNH